MDAQTVSLLYHRRGVMSSRLDAGQILRSEASRPPLGGRCYADAPGTWSGGRVPAPPSWLANHGKATPSSHARTVASVASKVSGRTRGVHVGTGNQGDARRPVTSANTLSARAAASWSWVKATVSHAMLRRPLAAQLLLEHEPLERARSRDHGRTSHHYLRPHCPRVPERFE